jgi:1-acyl-sn-glycerol-3-phosphate acyltransferase
MLGHIWAVIKGSLAGTMLFANVVAIFSGMVPFALAKLALPQGALRRGTDRILNALVEAWTTGNGWVMALVHRIRWDVKGVEGINRKGWYLVNSNHQSWVDILVLQKVFLRKAPFPKFFLKRELIYVPVLGLAWWALDFPFMRRRGGTARAKDLATAREACERFRRVPTALVNFLEGTRFSPQKHASQDSPFRHLLRPKAGGLATSLATLGDQTESLLDVTIVYPQGVPKFWDLLCGKVKEIVVRVRELEIPQDLRAGNDGDPAFRAKVEAWVNELWEEKDRCIEGLMLQSAGLGRAENQV